MKWSQFDLDAYNSKRVDFDTDKKRADKGKESLLSKKISDYCKDNGYYAFHDYSRGVNKAGHPDWVIALPCGRTIWLELKAEKGRLSSEQKVTICRLSGLRHEVYVINSFDKFIEIIKNAARGNRTLSYRLPN